MTSPYNLATLPQDDAEAALELAKELDADGALDGDAMRMILRCQSDPSRLLGMLAAAGLADEDDDPEDDDDN